MTNVFLIGIIRSFTMFNFQTHCVVYELRWRTKKYIIAPDLKSSSNLIRYCYVSVCDRRRNGNAWIAAWNFKWELKSLHELNIIWRKLMIVLVPRLVHKTYFELSPFDSFLSCLVQFARLSYYAAEIIRMLTDICTSRGLNSWYNRKCAILAFFSNHLHIAVFDACPNCTPESVICNFEHTQAKEAQRWIT